MPLPGLIEHTSFDIEKTGEVLIEYHPRTRYIAEYQGIEQVADFAAFIAEHGKLGAKLVNHYGSLEATREKLEDYYAGSSMTTSHTCMC